VPADQTRTQADKPLLAVLRGERRDPSPMWMMRQAGRYLPEYRQLRQDKGSFLDLVYDAEAAAEVTLQPLKRFPKLDAAILFSDILIVPFAIGQNLTFVTGEGPRLTPSLTAAELDDLTPYLARLEPVYETVRRVRTALEPGKALIGFAGSPWTVATYMVAGQGSRDQSEARRLAYADPERLMVVWETRQDSPARHAVRTCHDRRRHRAPSVRGPVSPQSARQRQRPFRETAPSSERTPPTRGRWDSPCSLPRSHLYGRIRQGCGSSS